MGVSVLAAGGLLTVLFTDRNYYPPGQPVRLSLFKLNVSGGPITLNYPTSQRFDFLVSSPMGPVWRWSFDRVFLPVTDEITLYPGQSLSYSALWPQEDNMGRRVPPGIYRITGWNTSPRTAFIRPSVFVQIGNSF